MPILKWSDYIHCLVFSRTVSNFNTQQRLCPLLNNTDKKNYKYFYKLKPTKRMSWSWELVMIILDRTKVWLCEGRPCCLVGSIPLGNIGWLPGTPPSPCREERNHHSHYCPLSHAGAGQFYRLQFCQPPVGVSVALTWFGNRRGGLGPPGYRGDMNGWKIKWKRHVIFIFCLHVDENLFDLRKLYEEWWANPLEPRCELIF